MHVPIFFILQSFHAYKLGGADIKVWKIAKRVVIPFLLTQFFFILIYYSIFDIEFSKDSILQLVKHGGIGPGTFFVWVYLELAVMIVVVKPLFDKLSRARVFMLFVFISVLLEMLLCYFKPPMWLYRLTFFRYFFLIMMGMGLVHDGIVMSAKTLLLSSISVFFVILLHYYDYDVEPFIYSLRLDANTHHWTCYFLTIPIMYIVWAVYNRYKNARINCIIMDIGKSSYEIFLIQMGLFTIIEQFVSNLFVGMKRSAFIAIVYFPSSILLGTTYHRIKCFILEKFNDKYRI